MIEKVAITAAHNYVEKGMIKKDEEEVCVYGLQLLMISIGAVLVISIVNGSLIQGMVYLTAYCILRSYSGGYHADTHIACISTFIGSFIVISNFVKYVDFKWGSYIYMLLLFCNAIIFIFAPNEAINNPISQRSKEKMKRKAHGCIIIFSVAVLFFWHIGLWSIAEFMVMGMFLCTVLVLVGGLKNIRWRKRNENIQEIS